MSNSGIISFAAKVDITTDVYPFNVAIGDIDGDGKPDLITANYTNSNVSVLRNTSSSGSISFATKIDFPVGSLPYMVVIGDIDGDGKPDIALSNINNSVSVLRNTSKNGIISFGPELNIGIIGSPRALVIGDIDGDGKPDLAVTSTNGNALFVFRNTSSSGTISFDAIPSIGTNPSPHGITIGDIDGDGKLDLAVSYNLNIGQVSIFRNTSNIGAVSFAPTVDINSGHSQYNIAIADINGDGKPDIAVPNYDENTVAVIRNNSSIGTISFATPVTMATGISPTGVTINDLDGDGKADIVVPNENSNTLSVIRNVPVFTADLADISLSEGSVSPIFAPATTTYNATVNEATASITLTPTATDPSSTIQVCSNGGGYSTVASGNASPALPLTVGSNSIEVFVTAPDGITTQTYTVAVCRPPSVTVSYNSTICAGTSTVFTLNGTPNATVMYDLNGATTATASLIGGIATIIIPNTTAAQTLHLLSITNGVCSQNLSTAATVSIYPVPIVSLSVASSTCSGVTLAATCTTAVGAGGYAWSNGQTTATALFAADGTYTVTATDANSCLATAAQAVTVRVIPTVDEVSNQSVCVNSTTAPVHFTGTGSTFTWANDNPAIGLAANGTGDIAAFAATNTTGAPLTATITATPISGATGFAYIANFGGTTVSVVDLATNTVTATIGVGLHPRGVCFSPDGSRVYVTNIHSNNLSVISTATNTVIATVGLAAGPIGVTTSPDGSRIYIANNTAGSVSVLDAATFATIATMPVADYPYTLSISSDGSRLYTPRNTVGLIAVMNTATNTVINYIATGGSNPYATALSPDDNHLYVTNSTNSNVSVINTNTNGIEALVSVGTSPLGIAVTPDGSRVYVANYNSNTVSVINTATNTTIATVPVGSNPDGVSVNADGSLVYVANTNSNNVSVISTATNTVVATIAVGAGPAPLGNFVSRTAQSVCTGIPKQFTITVNPTPVVSIGGNLAPCSGTSTLLTASGGSTYAWSNGATTAAMTTAAVGTYTVTATTASGCVSTASVTVVFNSNCCNLAITDLKYTLYSYNKSVLFLVPTLANSGGGTLAYAWNFGDGLTSTLSAPGSITYPTSGDKTVCLTVTLTKPDGTVCTTQCCRTFTIADVCATLNPTFSFTAASASLAYTFTGIVNAAGVVSTWKILDAAGATVTTATGNSLSYTFSAGGEYSVCRTVTASGGANGNDCSINNIRKITVVASTACNATARFYMRFNNAVISDKTVAFMNNSVGALAPIGNTGGLYWEYSTSPTGSFTAINTMPTAVTTVMTFTFPAVNTYWVRLTINKGTACETSIINRIDLMPAAVTLLTGSGLSLSNMYYYTYSYNKQVAFLTPSITGCTGTLSYAWDFGDGTTATTAAPTKVYTTAGLKPVCLTISCSNGSSVRVCRNINIPDVTTALKPTFSFSNPAASLAYTFTGTANAAGVNTVWEAVNSSGTATVFGGANNNAPTYTFPAAGEYAVCRTASAAVNTTNGIYTAIRHCRQVSVIPTTGCNATARYDGYNSSLTPLTVLFNSSSISATTVLWDYSTTVNGVYTPLGTAANAILVGTTFSFANTGVYFVRLTINKGTACETSVIHRLTLNSLACNSATVRTVNPNSDVLLLLPNDIAKTPTINIYPNPTSGVVTLDFDDLLSNQAASIQVLDMRGTLIMQLRTRLGDAQTNLDLSAQPNGMYLLQIRTDNGENLVRKVIKE